MCMTLMLAQSKPTSHAHRRAIMQQNPEFLQKLLTVECAQDAWLVKHYR